MCNKQSIWACVVALLLCVTSVLSGCSHRLGYITRVPDGELQSRVIVPASTPIEERELEGHQLIAKNQKYSLYVNDESVSIILEENDSGRIMRSAVSEPNENDNMMWRNFTMSGICIEYYTGLSTTTLSANMFLKSPNKTIVRTDNGFAAEIWYKELDIGFTVFVTLTEQGITAEIPQSSIIEGDNNKLGAVYLFPFLGYSFLGEHDGYML